MSTKKLDSLRLAIGDLRGELAEVINATMPPDDIKAAVRGSLQAAVDEFSRAQTNAAECIASGIPSSLSAILKSSYDRDEVAIIALGGALAAYGLDRFLDEAEAMAGEPKGLRLTAAQSEEKAAIIRRELYQLESEEEALVESLDAMRRPGVNVAAVLGIPLEIAEREGLVGGGT